MYENLKFLPWFITGKLIYVQYGLFVQGIYCYVNFILVWHFNLLSNFVYCVLDGFFKVPYEPNNHVETSHCQTLLLETLIMSSHFFFYGDVAVIITNFWMPVSQCTFGISSGKICDEASAPQWNIVHCAMETKEKCSFSIGWLMLYHSTLISTIYLPHL